MTEVNWQSRMIVSGLAIFSLMVHSGGDTASLVGISAGGALLMLGLWTMFRIASIAGFLIMTGISALFMDLDTMTDVQNVVFAVVGLFVPSLAAAWAALTAEDEHGHVLNLRTRAVAIAAIYGIVCMISVPIVMILSGVVMPSISSEVPVMVEIAILLLVASIPVAYFFSVEPERAETGEESPEHDEIPA